MKQTKPWLRYVEAEKINDKTLDLKQMKLRSAEHDELGSVDGLIVDSDSGRSYYVVIDAGGWFKSRHFLVPIGELHLDDDRDALTVNLTKEQIHRFPGFDKAEFDDLTENDIKRINDATCSVFEPTRTYRDDEPYAAAWDRSSYRVPQWWSAGLAGRMRGATSEMPVESEARGSYGSRRGTDAGERSDQSPHFDGRAQPGDVLGVETGGERTYVGETKEDENARRTRAEKAAHQGS